MILEAKSYRERIKRGEVRPFEVENLIVVTSYEFGALKADDLAKTNWDLVIFDEAHRLRNVYRKGASKRAKALRDALKDKFKLLLTATPLQNSLMELFGLVSVVDEKLFGDEASFKANYGGQRPGTAELLMLREIEELESYLALARSIPVNAKGEQLVQVLPSLLERIEKELGGQRKAVIFTESVRTQTYLADLLAANGYEGQIALLNGQNSDPESREIYVDWIKRQKESNSDTISGSKTADMKAAIIESFKERKTILIATESGAEGINLQFCSMIINFDLPWNPQRVEQRIGRCHRYGQKIDVLVVNFLNLKNRAEERVFELLDTKFKLFDGVFGASDEVLGAIENGTDFERRVFEIHQTARSDAEVNAEFDRLQIELDENIKADSRES